MSQDSLQLQLTTMVTSSAGKVTLPFVVQDNQQASKLLKLPLMPMVGLQEYSIYRILTLVS